MKHNSALKQVLREFNTQMALKEKELETSIKETIGKEEFLLHRKVFVFVFWKSKKKHYIKQSDFIKITILHKSFITLLLHDWY